ncbi:hypothetical protein GUJ93_ZPchr0013g34724 [Zizania palustris]|uniref:Uncharacterized protein n=1 Tax=Zizania palustris TaxID=103762 RepID=A0A8J5WU81_ZIZPA|nr:hypothetical protein GUJ93_ZPchr0013g34551 [Zizania palustris]KAG8097169.1 hypothetical protein GUJ93_ZPchr0013g34724 [Zizania palustris]
MRRSEWEDRCKRHLEHRMSKGVCPYCLRDRLAHLSASSSATTTTRASSSSATTSPSYSSGAGSPPPRHAALSAADVSSVHVVIGGGSSIVNVAAFSQPLMPSSIHTRPAAATQDEPNTEAAYKGKEEVKSKKSGVKKKKIGRFLSRLVGAEKRRQTGDSDDSELFHSKTMKEKTSHRWAFF